MTMRDSKAISKNEVEFRNYRKYSADAVIKFDTDAVAASSAPADGRTPMSVAQLKQFIHSSIEKKASDKQMAQHLQQCKLTDRLSDPDLMELINDGAGLETIEALKQMQEQSMSLPLPAQAAKPGASKR
jgi:succinylarginine dihydrolase